MGSHTSESSYSRSSEESLSHEPISLAVIVSHFVASKQSLASTQHVYRANEIVSNARGILETIATSQAKTAFLRNSIGNQLGILKSIRLGLGTVADDVSAEFKDTLRRLDKADVSIKDATSQLQSTTIEPCFRPPNTPPQTLHSFVDAQAIDELTAAFRESINHVTEAQHDFSVSNSTFDEEISQLEILIRYMDEPTPVAEDRKVADSIEDRPDADEPRNPASLFLALEHHAAETASLLQSLVRHYDLCITALKHTEGGPTAALQQAQASLPAGLAADVNVDIALDPATHALSTAERNAMLHVLDKDAVQVADVASEIRERAAAMEVQLIRLTAIAGGHERCAVAATKAVTALEILGANLPRYTRAAPLFTSRWTSISSCIADKLGELHALRDFFAGFLRAYDGLLLEVGRRKETRRRMDKIAEQARRQIESLYEGEIEEREVFRAECGEFLPKDLWEGFEDPPSMFKVERVDDGTCDIPEVPEEVLREAARRKEDGKGQG